MKRMLIVICICALLNSCSNAQVISNPGNKESKSTDKILYVFNDSIITGFLKGIEFTKKNMPNNPKDGDFFILIDENSGGTGYLFIINYSKDFPDFSPLIKSTSRFCEVKKELFLPIIFRYDLEFSSLFNKSNGEKMNFTVGGYTIVTDYQGNILRQGLTQ